MSVIRSLFSGLSVALLVVLVSFLLGCFNAKVWVEDPVDISLPVAGVQRISVESHNGRIEFEADQQASTIEVQAVRRAGGPDSATALEALDEIVVHTVLEDGVQKISWKWASEKDSSWAASVAFKVVVPQQLPIRAKTHNGRVTADGMVGLAELETHNGRIVITSHTGPVHAETHNGRIEASGEVPSLKLKSHNGRIVGDFKNAGPVSGSILTHNGRIQLNLSEHASTVLRCRTKSGSVRVACANHVEESSKNSFVGTVGEGGGELKLETHNGRIQVD